MRFRSPPVPVLASVCLSLVALGCSSDDGGETEDTTPDEQEEYLGLTTPEDGFQVRNNGTSIPGGADVEYCEVAELPGDPSDIYYVTSAEFGNGDYSHHLIVSAAVPGSPADDTLRDYEIGDSVPCLSAETAFGQDGMIGIGGTQRPYTIIDYPDGVGREYHGGQRVVFDYHYYNTGTDAVDARSAFNLHLVDSVEHIADTFAFTNWLIDTPPGETSSFVGECHFSKDVMVGGLTRHTHRWGTDYSVWYAGGANDTQEIFTSHDFQHDVDHSFEEPVLVKAGEGFRFDCQYENTESYPLRFGVNATDEMCILFGLIWDAGDVREAPSENCSIVYADEEGVGRPVTDTGFPAPTADQANMCIAGAAAQSETGTASECVTCQCNACANVLITCFTDPDCAVIMECVQNSPISECESVIDEHSTALGMLQQVRGCVDASDCSTLCEAAP